MANASDIAIAALSSCGLHNATHVPRLADCAHLTPSGTDSDTVSAFLRAAQSPWAHEDHRLDRAGAPNVDSLGYSVTGDRRTVHCPRVSSSRCGILSRDLRA